MEREQVVNSQELRHVSGTVRRLVLPWPVSQLSPNFHGKRRDFLRAKKAYHESCWASALEAGFHLMPKPEGRLPVTITICQPTGRVPRDDDNAKAAFKHGRDGIAKAMRVDDGLWDVTYLTGDRIKGGAIILEVVA